MEIDRVTTFVPSKVPFPERRKWQRPPCQEHKSDLGNPLERVPLHLGRPRRSPQELLVTHRVHQVRRRPDPVLQATRLLDAGLEGGACHREPNLQAGKVHGEYREASGESEHGEEDLEEQPRGGAGLGGESSRLRQLIDIIIGGGNPRLHHRKIITGR